MVENTVGNVSIYVWIVVCLYLAAIMFVWIILRPLRLWYWKRNEEVELLRSIDEKLSFAPQEQEFDDIPKMQEPQVHQDSTKSEEFKETNFEVALEADDTKPQKHEEAKAEDTTKSEVCEKYDEPEVTVAKKARTYTEEELYEIIKF